MASSVAKVHDAGGMFCSRGAVLRDTAKVTNDVVGVVVPVHRHAQRIGNEDACRAIRGGRKRHCNTEYCDMDACVWLLQGPACEPVRWTGPCRV